MKATELRDMQAVELNKKLNELKQELFNLRFQHAINQLDNPQRITTVKREIARVKTVMHELHMDVLVLKVQDAVPAIEKSETKARKAKPKKADNEDKAEEVKPKKAKAEAKPKKAAAKTVAPKAAKTAKAANNEQEEG